MTQTLINKLRTGLERAMCQLSQAAGDFAVAHMDETAAVFQGYARDVEVLLNETRESGHE